MKERAKRKKGKERGREKIATGAILSMRSAAKLTKTKQTWMPKLLRKWNRSMGDKLMYIPNDDTQNYPFCRLQLVVEMYGHST